MHAKTAAAAASAVACCILLVLFMSSCTEMRTEEKAEVTSLSIGPAAPGVTRVPENRYYYRTSTVFSKKKGNSP